MKFLRKKIYNLFRNPSINLVALFIILLNTFVLLILTSIVLLSRYSQSNTTVAMQNTEQTTTNIAKSIETFVEERIDNLIWVKENRGALDLATIHEINTDIIMVGIFDEKGELINYAANDNLLLKNISPAENLSFFNYSNMIEDAYYIAIPHVNNMFVEYYPWVVTFTTKTRINDEIYYIIMDIELDKMSQYIDKILIGDRGYVFIADNNGNIVYHPQQRLIHTNLKEENQDILLQVYQTGSVITNSNIYSSAPIESTNWNVIGVSNMDELVSTISAEFTEYAIIILVSAVVVSLLLVRILFSVLTLPMKRLINDIKSFEQNMDTYTYKEIKGVSEFVELQISFEHMVTRIKLLIEQLIKNEKELQKFELKALQAQINPHFLYNTLDSIFWLCKEDGNDDAANMVAALSNTFRISISRGQDEIFIHEEIRHVQSYLIILNLRYKNQFSYKFEVDAEISNYKCLKILLQPFVENAIYHGLNRMIDEGEIIIKGYKQDNSIIFKVIDNGIGMDEYQISQLYIENNDKTGIGVKNVHDRIRVFYGEDYGVSIKSDLDEGTEITLKIPIVKEEEK